MQILLKIIKKNTKYVVLIFVKFVVLMEQENLQSIITDDELSKLIDGVSVVDGGAGGGGAVASSESGLSSGGEMSEVEVDLTDRVSKYRDAILDVETGGLWGRYRVLSEGGDEDELVEFYNEVMKKDVDIDELEGKERERALKKIRRELDGHFGKVAEGVMGNFRVKVSGVGSSGSNSGGSGDFEEFSRKVNEVIDLIDSGELSIGGYKLSGIKQAVGGDYTFVGGDERELLARLAIVSNDSAFNYFVRAIASELGRRIVKEVSRRYAGAGTGVTNPGATGLTGGGTNKVLEALSARARQHVIKEV